MRLCALGFFLGVCFLQFFTVLPCWGWVFVPFLLGLAFFMLWRQYHHSFFLALIAIMLGLSWSWAFSAYQLSGNIPEKFLHKVIKVSVHVIDVPSRRGRVTAFTALLTNIDGHKLARPAKINLSWFYGHSIVHAGDAWSLQVKLKPPHGLSGPGVFDREKALFAQGVKATGYVVHSSENHKVGHYGAYVNRFREFLANKIQNTVKIDRFSSIIAALTVGIKSGIDADAWRVLRLTGTAHLVAISGLHVGLIYGFMFAMVLFFWKRCHFLVLRYPAKQAAAISGLIMAIGYSALAGFSLSTERAVIMLAVFTLCALLKKSVLPWTTLCLSLLIVLIINPLSVLTVGFFLSFSAVTCILWIVYTQDSRLKILKIQLAITGSLWPLNLLFFGQASLVSLLANIIAIPFVGFLVVPSAFLGCFSLIFSHTLASYIFSFSHQLLVYLWIFLEYLANISWSSWVMSIDQSWVFMSAGMGVVFLLLPLRVPCKMLCIFYFLPLFFHTKLPAKGSIKFTLLDVGQGLASVVQTRHHVLVYDTGPHYAGSFDAGQSVLLPFLHDQYISHVDRLVISHGDNDHVGGARALLSNMPVSKIDVSSRKILKPFKRHLCLQGAHWVWDGVRFEFLYPTKKMLGLNNNSSCILKVSTQTSSLLLVGDIEKPAEDYLLKHHADLKSTVLVTPHHGSKTSSSSAFVKAVKPDIVLFPVGYYNRFHFPHESVVNRYRKIGAKLYDTVNYGAISVELPVDTKRAVLGFYRLSHQHYWRQN